MPATISDIPAISFSRNEISVEITSNTHIETPGTNAVVLLSFLANIADGLEISLIWAKGEVKFKASAAWADDSGEKFPPGAISEAYVRSLIPIFSDNYYIDSDFTLEYHFEGGHHCILFTSKETGQIYNISPITTAQFAISQTTIATTEQLKPNFSHHLQILIKENSAFTKIYESNLQLDYPVTGKTSKDIAPIIHSYLKNESDRPSLIGDTWQPCSNSLKEYQLVFAQYFGDTPVVKKITRTASAFVNLGGLAVAAAPGQTVQEFLRPLGNDKNALCLRQGSGTKRVQLDQPEFLYWLNVTGSDQQICMRYQIFYTDGTNNTFLSPVFTCEAWRKAYIAVGYQQAHINANLLNGKTSEYYSARVVSAAGAFLSRPYNYTYDKYRAYSRYFIYRNSLGGFTTLYTWGKAQQENDRTKTDILKQVTQAQTASTGGAYENNIRLQDKYTVNTGYTTAREISLLKDFFLSDDKYLVDGRKLIPIGISTSNLKQPEDGENLNGASFTYYPLFDEVAYTDNVNQVDDQAGGSGSVGGGGTVGYNAIIDRGNNADNPHYIDL